MPPIKRNTFLSSAESDAEILKELGADEESIGTFDYAVKHIQSRPGRPSLGGKKIQVTLRIDAEIVESFRQTGTGWQTRMNDALKDWLNTHRVS